VGRGGREPPALGMRVAHLRPSHKPRPLWPRHNALGPGTARARTSCTSCRRVPTTAVRDSVEFCARREAKSQPSGPVAACTSSLPSACDTSAIEIEIAFDHKDRPTVWTLPGDARAASITELCPGVGRLRQSPSMPQRRDGQDRLPRLLSRNDLKAHRSAWRRRPAWSALLIAVCVAIAIAVVSSGSSRLPERTRLASRVPVPALDRPARPPTHRSDASLLAVAPIARVLAYTSYVAAGTPRKREVALTFDDGPGPYTSQIIRILQRSRTPATFFVIGEWAGRYPTLVRAEARDGFEVGDHTETHPFMAALAAPLQRLQIVDAASSRAAERRTTRRSQSLLPRSDTERPQEARAGRGVTFQPAQPSSGPIFDRRRRPTFRPALTAPVQAD
jgi:hypothetical protein